mgnify:CR=1 FL=1
MKHHLAQLNIARLKEPLDSPLLADFVANLDRINALAERSPGFVWRLETEEGDATAIRPFGPEYIVNLSVWEDIASLHAFVYRSAHAGIMSRRREWFERMGEAWQVLWWTEAGRLPTVTEARERLEHLRRHGPTPEAFTFRKAWPAPGAAPDTALPGLDEPCPA